MPLTKQRELPITYADLLGKYIDLIVRLDGDRDHMNASNLNCEQTMALVQLLRRCKLALGDEAAHD